MAVAIIGWAAAPHPAAAAPASRPPVAPVLVLTADPAPPIPDDIVVDTTNPFLPVERDLTDCIGTMERPGCGSAARGGWHQELVAIAMIGGLVLVFGRVAWAVLRSQKKAKDSEPTTP